MSDVATLAVKGLAGGALVVAFALLGEAVKPKRFAGLFGAAPAVALAGLTVTLLTKGVGDARHNVTGMVAGAAGMVVYAALVVVLLRRVPARAASSVALLVWAVVTAAVAVPLAS